MTLEGWEKNLVVVGAVCAVLLLLWKLKDTLNLEVQVSQNDGMTASMAGLRDDTGAPTWRSGMSGWEPPVFWNGGSYSDVRNDQTESVNTTEGMRRNVPEYAQGMVGQKTEFSAAALETALQGGAY
jgi:hypothetical protein